MNAQLTLLDSQPVTKPYTGTVIYETAGRAREYRELACNIYSGCDHCCIYCYAPNALQRDRATFHAQVQPRKDILAKLAKDAAGYGRAGETRQVLFCFATDPYCHADEVHGITRRAIQLCHQHGLSVCTLTKGGSRSLRDLDLFGSGDSYACTLTSLDPAVSARWEPSAAPPQDRIETLRTFHEAGIRTWISLEPVIDPSATLEIIRETALFTDEYKIGPINYSPIAKTIDWHRFAHQAKDLLESLGCNYYFKSDLRKWL